MDERDVLVGGWGTSDFGLEEPEEQEAARVGRTAVEAEHELVQLRLEMLRLHTALIRSLEHTLRQGEQAIHARQ